MFGDYMVFPKDAYGVFLVVTFSVLVGRRTGPLTRRSLLFARSINSLQTNGQSSEISRVVNFVVEPSIRTFLERLDIS